MTVYKHVMVDLETLSTRSDATILTLGAIKFNLEIPMVPPVVNVSHRPDVSSPDDTIAFYRRVDIESCDAIGLHRDPSTEQWWSRQSESARTEAFGEGRETIQRVLEDFCVWLGNDVEYVWSQGTDFDISILKEVYRRCGVSVPWKFWNVRDSRTVMDMAGVTSRDLPPTQHHAVMDCHRQIQGVQLSLERLGLLTL